ncbi:hypothetical protein BRARA_C03856 [Brassica rapa]|uniref:Uncharacterized protein n=1 Tax=Brassica campestris TaxID=3711 RepID=A0A398A9L4_BRACM|nr:hypothetical protein BRARA_C03856 [Brassica rapa]
MVMIRIFRGLEFQIWALHPVVEDTTLGCLTDEDKTIILADFSEVL